ncbi:DUF6090 family protein [Robiginitalea marina]|uniref:DUF6090 family protein n=1 Tax=Robiginitalea marina TaxID=2954105 RepID=A0ABT1B284_9FLAO|nr:DUF6090 family protein [Robiginitalea marina]MCO5726037.1 DUF6090 family protein [Robiginitalea marina]
MLRFFRTLRQRLLAENKVSRYLLYAVGEIVLVVIGILIALQINTWNEARENSRAEHTFYRALLVDLESDQARIDVLSAFYLNRIENLTWLLTRVRNPDLPAGPLDFGKHVEPLYYTEAAISYDATYEASKSSGAFDHFADKALLKQAIEYYSGYTDLENVHTSTLRYVETAFEPLMAPVTNNFMGNEAGEGVLIAGGNTGFYTLLGSIKDQRAADTQKEIREVLQKTQFESFLIGDLGRSFNMIRRIETRTLQLNALKVGIGQFLDD